MTESKTTSACGICAMINRIKAHDFRDELYLMPAEAARTLFEEMRLTAEAIATIVKPWKMNYECLGNLEPHVHWHLLPRDENDELRHGPVWLRPETERKVPLDENDRRALMESIRRQLALRFPDARIPST